MVHRRAGLAKIAQALAVAGAVALISGIGFVQAAVPKDASGRLLPLPDGFPNRVITIWNAFGPEHPEAVRANLLAEAASRYSPVPVIGRSMSAGPAAHYDAWRRIELEPGGTDGYHVFTISWSGLMSRLITRDSRGYGPMDLAHSALTVDGEEAPLLVRRAGARFPWNNVQEMIEWARQNPGRLRAATSNVGSGYHLNFMLLAEQAGFDFAALPTDGQGEALHLILGGGADVGVVNLTLARPHLETGRLEILMQWAEARMDVLPDVPASAELGYTGFPRTVGVAMHPATPPEHAAWLEELFVLAAEAPNYRNYQVDSGFTPVMIRGDDARAYVAQMFGTIYPVLKDLGLARDDL